MALRFPTPEPTDRSVPDFRSRSGQLRWFVFLAGLMAVGFAVTHLGDPRLWQLLGGNAPGIAGGPPLLEREKSDREVDTRWHLPEADPDPSIAGPDRRLLPLLPENRQRGNAPRDAPIDDPVDSPIERAWLHGWQTLFEKLEPHDRDILFRGLRSVRHRQVIALETWPNLVETLDRLWTHYRTQALEMVEKLPPDQQGGWQLVVDHLERRWTDDWRPRLDRWANLDEMDEASCRFATELQSILDPLALDAVRDDAILSRAAEREIWFRLFEQLAESTPAELRQQSIGPTGYLPLYDQPRSHRGQIVTVRGVVLQAYFVPESQRASEIAGYYVFTLRPAGGPARPIVVYALELPSGFPEVDRRATNGQTTRLHEEVEFTGFFFKRMPYLAQDGLNRALVAWPVAEY